MPVYVYKNLNTGEIFELEQRITEDALQVHPETGEPVKRIVQPVGIAFKGSGFYVNDSRRAGAAKSPEGTTDSKSDKKADTKTGEKSDKGESKQSATSSAP